MNQYLQAIKEKIEGLSVLSEREKEEFMALIQKLDKEIYIQAFKLDRTEKVKRTTSVLLEETIEELEQKRKDVEETNAALKESLEELKATQEQLIHAEKMASLGELTAGIAHEIQNPLNFVNNFSELNEELIDEIRQELDSGNLEEVKEILEGLTQNEEKIKFHGKRAEGIVKSMLQHSRGSEGQKEWTELNALCDEYLRLAYHGFRAKDKSFNVQLETSFDDQAGKLEIIPQDIGRVVLNLINNAFQAVQERSLLDVENYHPTVSISTKKIDNKIEISIEDNGPGIKTEIRNKIFQPFFSTKPTGQGTGLGLSLAYDIVKAHGGTLKVESEVNRFSKFTVLLPL